MTIYNYNYGDATDLVMGASHEAPHSEWRTAQKGPDLAVVNTSLYRAETWVGRLTSAFSHALTRRKTRPYAAKPVDAPTPLDSAELVFNAF